VFVSEKDGDKDLVRVCICEPLDERERVTACARVCVQKREREIDRKSERECKGESERKIERGTRMYARTHTPGRERERDKVRE